MGGKVVWGEDDSESKGRVQWGEEPAPNDTTSDLRSTLSEGTKEAISFSRKIGRGISGGVMSALDFAAQIPELPVLGGAVLSNLGLGYVDKFNRAVGAGQGFLANPALVPPNVYKPPEDDSVIESAAHMIESGLESGRPSKYLDPIGRKLPGSAAPGKEVTQTPEYKLGYNVGNKILGAPGEGGTWLMHQIMAGGISELAGEERAKEWLQNPESTPAASAIGDTLGMIGGYMGAGKALRLGGNALLAEPRRLGVPEFEKKEPTLTENKPAQFENDKETDFAYDSMSNEAKSAIGEWISGKLDRLRKAAKRLWNNENISTAEDANILQEIYTAGEAGRNKLKSWADKNGNIILFRGLRKGETPENRPEIESYTTNENKAKEFAGENGRVEKVAVPLEDVLFAYGEAEGEILVRNRKKTNQGEPYKVEDQWWRGTEPQDMGPRVWSGRNRAEERIDTGALGPEDLIQRGREEPTGTATADALLSPEELAKKEERKVYEAKQQAAYEKALGKTDKELEGEVGKTRDLFESEERTLKEEKAIKEERDKLREAIYNKELEPIKDQDGKTTGWMDKEGKEYSNEQVADAYNQDLAFEKVQESSTLTIRGPKTVEAELKPLEMGKGKGRVVWEEKTREELAKEREGKIPVEDQYGRDMSMSMDVRFPKEEMEYTPPNVQNIIEVAQNDPFIARYAQRIEQQTQLINELRSQLATLQEKMAGENIANQRAKLRDEYNSLSDKVKREMDYQEALNENVRQRYEMLKQYRPTMDYRIEKNPEFNLGEPTQSSNINYPTIEKPFSMEARQEPKPNIPDITLSDEQMKQLDSQMAPYHEKTIQAARERSLSADPVSTIDFAVRNDFQGLLKHVEKTAKDPFNALLARKLRNLNMKDVGVEMKAGAALEQYPGSTGGYSPARNSVVFNPIGVASLPTVLHEGVHAALNNLIASKPEHPSVKAITELFEFTKRKSGLGAQDHYGLTDVYEFVAEIANKEFQSFLKNIPVTAAEATKMGLGALAKAVHNAWDAFVAIAAKYLGLKPNETNALSVLLNEGSKLLDQSTAEMRNRGVRQEPSASVPQQSTKGVVKSVQGITLLDKRTGREVIEDALKSGKMTDIPATTIKENILQGRDVAGLTVKYNPFVRWYNQKVLGIDRDYRIQAQNAIKGSQWEQGRRWGHRVRKDFTGATTFLRDFGQSAASKLKVANTLWEYDSLGKTPTRQELLRRGLSLPEAQAVETVHKRLREFYDKFNALSQKLGFNQLNLREGFMPHLRPGDYLVYVKDPNGVNVHISAVANEYQAKVLKADLQQTFPQHKVEFDRATSRYDINDLSPYFEMLRELNSKSKDYKIINDAVGNILAHRGFQKHGLFREGLPGFLGPESVKDTITAIETYLEKGYRYLANQEKNAAFSEFYKELKQHGVNPKTMQNTIKYMEHYRENSTGAMHNYAQAIDKVLEYAGEQAGKINIGSPSSFKRGLSTLNGFASALWLFTLKFAGMQTVQPMYSIPKLWEVGRDLGIDAVTMNAKLPTALMTGWKEAVMPSADAKAAMNYAKKTGYVDSMILDFFDTNLRDNKPTKVLNSFSKAVHWTLGKVEQEVVRTPTYLMFNHLFKDIITDDKTRWDLAGELTDHVMMDYSKTEKPFMYSRLGAFGQAAAPLKTYSHGYIGQMINYFDRMKTDKMVAPFALFMGVQLLLGGLTGMVGVDVYDETAKKLNTWFDLNLPTVEQFLLHSGAGDLISFGGVSTITGMNMSGSLSAPQLGGFFSLPGVGMAAKAATTGTELLRKSLNGTDTASDRMKFLQTITPASLQGTLEKEFTQPGMGPPNPNNKMMPDLPQRTEGLFQPNSLAPSDMAARWAGGRSLKEAESMRAIAVNKQEQAAQTKKRSELEEAMLEKLISGKDVKDLVQRWVEAGGNGQNLVGVIKKRLIDRNLNYAQKQLMQQHLQPQEFERRFNIFKDELEKADIDSLVELEKYK